MIPALRTRHCLVFKELWLAPLKGEPSSHSTHVSKHGRVQDLKNALDEQWASLGGPRPDMTRYSLCEAKDNRILRVLVSSLRRHVQGSLPGPD